jgi:hypothetical protein
MVEVRDPGINDNKYPLGTLWLNNNAPYNVWILVNVAKGIATWIQLSTGGGVLQTLTSNTGGAVSPTAGNINVVGDGVTITGAGNPGTSTITFSVVGGAVLSTLTGNSGGAVSPNMGNINIVGSGLVTVVGNPGTNTLTISAGGAAADSFPTDSGTATPAGGILNVLGGTAGRDIDTSGSGNTIHIDLKNSITLGDLSNLGTADAITATTGNITVTAGNINMALANTAGTVGVYKVNNNKFLYAYPDITGTFVGAAGNTTGSGRFNTAVGDVAGVSLTTGAQNTLLGWTAGAGLTTGGENTAIGYGTGATITTGSRNTLLGFNAGVNYAGAESNNIMISNTGVVSESNVMRLGTSGSGGGQVSTAYIAGTYAVNVGSVASVVSIASTGQIGSTVITGGSGITVTPGANTITISGSGVIVFNYTNVNTTPYVVGSTDEYLSVDSSGAPITVELPNAAPSTGRVYYIKDRTGSAGTNNITITTVGGAVTIDGSTSFVMNTNYEAVNVIFNGTNYEIF